MKTYVYVDGFNLYYGALRGTKHKWVDIDALLRKILPQNQIVAIKYFTARVSARPGDPDQPMRQQTYIRALETIPHLTVHYGHFLTHCVPFPECTKGERVMTRKPVRYHHVWKAEEKGSDVNLASHLLVDAFDGLFDVAAVVSDDSDLALPIEFVCRRFGKKVGMISPRRKTPVVLQRCATFMRPIRSGVLSISQFPPQMADATGAFQKPAAW